jgi:predicted RNA-binding protein (virulence factor B family)
MLVRKLTTKFGENAGKIWQALQDTDTKDEESLKKSTNLSKNDFYAGVGWLARENKIKKVDQYYELDSTNLTNSVGTAAGRVYKILDIWDEADITTLKKLSDTDEKEVYAALGWLAKEGKVVHESGKYTLKSPE